MPHTADVLIEAWGPDLAACCEEAVAALVAVYTEAGSAQARRSEPITVRAPSAEALVLDVLGEVIFWLDTSELVPIGLTVHRADDRGLAGTMTLADPDELAGTGAAPKAISRAELAVEQAPGQVRCRFLVDV